MSAWTQFRSQGVALYAFAGDGTAQLALNPGDVVEVTQQSSGWYRGVLLASNREGIFPASYVRLYELPESDDKTEDNTSSSVDTAPATAQPQSQPQEEVVTATVTSAPAHWGNASASQSSSHSSNNNANASAAATQPRDSVEATLLPGQHTTAAPVGQAQQSAPIPESQRAPVQQQRPVDPAAGGNAGGAPKRSAETSQALELIAMMGGEIETAFGDPNTVPAAELVAQEQAQAAAPEPEPAPPQATQQQQQQQQASLVPPAPHPAEMRKTADGPPPPAPTDDDLRHTYVDDGPPPPPVDLAEDGYVPPPPLPEADDDTVDQDSEPADSEPADSDYEKDDDDVSTAAASPAPAPSQAAPAAQATVTVTPAANEAAPAASANDSDRAPAQPARVAALAPAKKRRQTSTLTVPGGSDEELGRSSVVRGGAQELLRAPQRRAAHRLTTNLAWPVTPQPLPGSYVIDRRQAGPRPPGDAVATFHTSHDDEFDPRIMRRVVAGARNDDVPDEERTLLRDLYLEMDAALTHRYQVKAHEVLLHDSPILDPSMFDKVMRFFSSDKEDKGHASIPVVSLSKHQLDFGLKDPILPLNTVLTDTITIANTHKKLKATFQVLNVPQSDAFELTITPLTKSIAAKASFDLKFQIKLLKSSSDLDHVIKLGVKNGLSHYIAMSFEPEKQVFGVPWELVEMCESDGYRVPSAVVALRDYLFSEGGLDIVGIFRLAADETEMPSLKKLVNQGKFTSAKNLNCVSTLIKVYFREMPVPLLNVIPADKFMSSNDATSCIRLADELPQPNKGVFEWLLDLMVTVTKNSKVNLMNTKAISIVIAPNLFLPDKDDDPMKGLLLSQKTVNFVQHNLVHRLKAVHGIENADG